MLAIALEQLGYIIARARFYDAAPTDLEDAPPTVAGRDVDGDDPTRRELVAAIRGLDVEQRVDLIALMWLGRGDGDVADWAELRELALQRHNRHDAEYLVGTPLLADYLEEGAANLGFPMEAFEC